MRGYRKFFFYFVVTTIAYAAVCGASSAQYLNDDWVLQPSFGSNGDSGVSPHRAKEDFETLKLDGSSLTSEIAVLSETDDLPNEKFIRYRYRVQWRAVDPMDLYIILPRQHDGPLPAVLYLYTFPQDTERFNNNSWCARVTAGGYAAVGFVSALTGHRYHDRPMKEWFVSELQESLVKSVHDVQKILDYLQTRDDIDMHRIAMFGQGSGGTIAILAAAVDARIKSVDVLTPWADWPEWFAKTRVIHDDERETFAKTEFQLKLVAVDPVKLIAKVKSPAIRIQDVRTDATVPANSQQALEAAAPARAMINQFGDGMALKRVETGDSLFEWNKTQLAQGDATKHPNDKVANTHNFPARGSTINSTMVPENETVHP